MPRRKTKFLHWGHLQYQIDQLGVQVRKLLRGFKGQAPADLQNLLALLVLYREASYLFLERSSMGDRLRLHLVRFLVSSPEYTIGGLQVIRRIPSSTSTASAEVREFFLTQGSVLAPGVGERNVVALKDDEIVDLASKGYPKPRNRPLKVRKSLVYSERRRLERLYGAKVTQFVNFYLDMMAGLDQSFKEGAAREERRAEAIAAIYR